MATIIHVKNKSFLFVGGLAVSVCPLDTRQLEHM